MTQKDSSSSLPLQDPQSVRIAIAEGETLPIDADIVLLPGRAAFLPKTSTYEANKLVSPLHRSEMIPIVRGKG